ncbi:hypothetical protein MMC25_005214 [Agyrium rufum]|nr:hypothetical protein [Agyrium rufum]
MDSPPPSDLPPQTSGTAPAPTASNLENEVDTWRRTGIFPFPELGLGPEYSFSALETNELRLLHHISSIYRDLARMNMLQYVPWIQRLPDFLAIANWREFVMHAILALSATHLAYVTGSPSTDRMALEHRQKSLEGLSTAMGELSQSAGEFFQPNADALLAAQLLLSWQVKEWSEWTSLTSGMPTVLSSFSPWQQSSNLAAFIDEDVIFRPASYMREPAIVHGGAPYLAEDDPSISEAIDALRILCGHLPDNTPLRHHLEEALQACDDVRTWSAKVQPNQLFEKVQPLRARILWMPVRIIRSAGAMGRLEMISLAHLYAAAMAIDASLPEMGGAGFGAVTSKPLQEILQLQALQHDDLLHFPNLMAARSQPQSSTHSTLDFLQAEQIHSHHNSPYLQPAQGSSAPSTPGFTDRFAMLATHSTEDLSVPPSPFLQYTSTSSRRQSQLIEHSPRPTSIHSQYSYHSHHDSRGSFSPGPSATWPTYLADSPAFSPETLPWSSNEEQQGSLFTEPLSGYSTGRGFVSPAQIWT